MQQPDSPPRKHTVEDYLSIEESSDTRHTFRDGSVIAVPLQTGIHDKIALRIWRLLSDSLGDDCQAFSIDVPVQTDPAGYCYPDVLVVAGPVRHDPPGTRFAVANPRLIIEVLSPDTEVPDRAEKLHRYIAMESLREYVLIAQDTARIETFFKLPDGVWAIPGALESLDDIWRSRSLPGVELPLAKVYEGIEFPPRKERTGDRTPDPDRAYTVEEYLDFEMSTEWQYDYRDGTITPKVHPGIDHMTIGMNLLVAFGNRLDNRPGEAWMGSVRVAADLKRCFLHPDMSVTAEKSMFLPPEDNISLINPVLVIEIFSAETYNDDHGAKFEWYRQIESLREYLLIAEDRPRVESFSRQADGAWISGESAEGMDGVWKSRSLGIEVPLSQIFSDVVFSD